MILQVTFKNNFLFILNLDYFFKKTYTKLQCFAYQTKLILKQYTIANIENIQRVKL